MTALLSLPALRTDRQHLLTTFIDRIQDHREAITRILLEISDRRAVGYEIDAALATLRGAAAEVEHHQPATVGSLAVFLPSNVLLYSWVLYVAVPLQYAHRVELRAASTVRPQMQRLHALLTQGLELPVTLHELSQRHYLEQVVDRADVVVFTGAYQNAESIRHQLSPEQLMLFLGSGTNPFVVGPEADLNLAVEQLVSIRCLNSGQDCLAPDVIWVHASVQETFLRLVHGAVDGLVCGEPTDPSQHRYGQIVYGDALGATAAFLFKHRERIVAGGSVHLASAVIEPTVLLWDDRPTKVASTEFFAPVFNVALYQDEAALVELLLDGRYAETAMGVSLFGCTDTTAERLRRLYTVTVDQTMLAVDNGNQPLGGRGPMANYVAHRGELQARPILISQAVAEYIGHTDALGPVLSGEAA